MTLLVITESHGDIDSGYYGSFSDLFRFGEYNFSTRQFCELVQHIARTPDFTQAQLPSISEELYENSGKEHARKVCALSLNAVLNMDLHGFDVEKESLEKALAKDEGDLSHEEEIILCSMGTLIPFVLRESSMIVGQYTVKAFHFGSTAVYAAQGGFFGWCGSGPEYAEATLTAMKESQNPFFEAIQKEL